MRISSLHIYPVKAVRACDVDAAAVEEIGLAGDRRWLVVDDEGAAITQRTHPKLATIAARIGEAGLTLSAPGADDLHVEKPDGAARLDVEIWGDTVSAALAGAAAARWVSDVLGGALQLVCMDGKARREKKNEWTPQGALTSFADAYPVLITTTGSLRAVNEEIEKRGGDPVTMRRFRPNIVIDCDDPWREDYWRRLRIGPVELDLVKPCARCVVTTKDQLTGADMGKEPLASLARIRRSIDPGLTGVMFGWNAAPRALGRIAVGERVEIMEERPGGIALARG